MIAVGGMGASAMTCPVRSWHSEDASTVHEGYITTCHVFAL